MTSNVVEVQENDLPTVVLDAVAKTGEWLDRSVDLLAAQNLSPTDALKTAGRAAGVVGILVQAR